MAVKDLTTFHGSEMHQWLFAAIAECNLPGDTDGESYCLDLCLDCEAPGRIRLAME